MNRRLLILPVVGAAALAGTQFLGGETELPPEPAFPTVANHSDATWTEDTWSVNRFVDDPFATSDDSGFDTGLPLDAGQPPVDDDADEAGDPDATTVPPASGSSGSPSPAPAPAPTTVAPTPTTTSAPAPTTTARDLSQAPPLADDGSGVDVPEIDDLPDPLGTGDGR